VPLNLGMLAQTSNNFAKGRATEVNGTENQIEVMSEQALEKILQLKPGALRRMRREWRGPTYCRVGRLIRYRRSAVEEWLKAAEGK